MARREINGSRAIVTGASSGIGRAIAVELVFGAATTSGGIGWTIYMSYFDMETPLMIAAIMTIAIVGVLTEKLGMENLEKKTVLRWGMIQKTETMGAQ